MAAAALQARVERMSVHGHDDAGNISTMPQKPKVAATTTTTTTSSYPAHNSCSSRENKAAARPQQSTSAIALPPQEAQSQAKQRPTLKTLSIVLSKTSDETIQTRETVPVIKQPVIKQFHLGMFEIGRSRGKGKFGRVYLARERQSGFVCASKVMYKHEIQHGRVEKQVAREIEIQTHLRHPNVVQLHGHFTTATE
ncbi:Serine/threonine-protein kinase ark1 [Tolypocladium capitatum]|uniref:Serine/threonine-protein kinase ark1 n=1 Tax=Tolypocladium capitatum TaxID=45235 RepID=A0A2K3QE70_9HYPO|nr:Serine/threonine-protein kinase ark1 [Tolypocladium capitatum]